MVSVDVSEEYLNEEYIGQGESLMYIDEDVQDTDLCRQNSLTGVRCRKKCVVGLDNTRYTIGKDNDTKYNYTTLY